MRVLGVNFLGILSIQRIVSNFGFQWLVFIYVSHYISGRPIAHVELYPICGPIRAFIRDVPIYIATSHDSWRPDHAFFFHEERQLQPAQQRASNIGNPCTISQDASKFATTSGFYSRDHHMQCLTITEINMQAIWVFLSWRICIASANNLHIFENFDTSHPIFNLRGGD